MTLIQTYRQPNNTQQNTTISDRSINIRHAVQCWQWLALQLVIINYRWTRCTKIKQRLPGKYCGVIVQTQCLSKVIIVSFDDRGVCLAKINNDKRKYVRIKLYNWRTFLTLHRTLFGFARCMNKKENFHTKIHSVNRKCFK